MKHRIVRSAMLAFVFAATQVHALEHPVPKIPQEVSNPAWEQDIQRFEATDAANPPPAQAIVFVGSSSIRLWESLAADFPDQAVINRGFGGSQLRDSTWYADRIVVPYAPRLIVLYAGDNDLLAGRTPAQVREDFVAFVQRVHQDLPKTRIAYISIKPSPARTQLMPQMVEANKLIRHATAQLPRVDFIDIYPRMLDASGQPRGELFGPDRLHMNRAGYELWRDAIAPELARR